MSTLDEKAMAFLKGSTQLKPMRLNDWADKLGLTKVGMGLLADRLRESRAINLATITKDGETHDVAWPTGLPPRPVNREIVVNGLSKTDRFASQQAAHAALNRVEPQPKEHEKDTPMPRIAKPAKPRPERDTTKHDPRKSPTMDACLAILEQEHAMALTSEDVFGLIPPEVGTTQGAVDITLRKLKERGRIQGEKAFINSRHRWTYWINTPRGMKAEDKQPVFEAGPMGGGDIYAPDEATVAQAAADAVAATPDTRTAHMLGLDAPLPRWALWDDGSLVVSVGDEMIFLGKADARRLAEFLEGCMEAMA